MESVYPSEIALMRRTFWKPVSSFRHPFGIRISPRLCSCKVEGEKQLFSKNAYVLKMGLEEKAAAGEPAHLLNGINGKNTKSGNLLDAFEDEYGGLVVDSERLPVNPDTFAFMLHHSLLNWGRKGKKGVWLKLPVDRSDLVPVAIKEGFEYHHAEKGYVMLTYWLPEGPNMLPANASHQVGVGGFVINDQDEILVVQEKYYAPAFAGSWKIPTGVIHESEEIFSGAVREVKEETGIDTEFVEVIAFRHAHNVVFQKSDLFFVCLLKPLSTRITIDHLEIEAAKWMPLREFVEQPMVQGDCMFKRIIDICIARLGKRYCGLSVHQLVSAFDANNTSSLYYNVVDKSTTDINCIDN